MDYDTFAPLTWVFAPEIAGIDIADGKSVSGVKYTVPDKIDVSMGKVPGSIEKQIAEDRECLRKKKEEEGLD